jgi:hypothetical protein
MRREGNVFNVQIRTVCRLHCNSGWMSRLETAVEPTLTPLMNGHAAVLGEAEQRTLATWIAMKIMVAESAEEEPTEIVTPQSERLSLMEKKQPPESWNIWIAHHKGPGWQAGYANHLTTLGLLETEKLHPPGTRFPKNTQVATMGIGQLLAHVAHSTYPGVNIQLPPKFMPIVRQIWPFQAAFLWPPGPILNDDGADDLFESFGRTLAAIRAGWLPGETAGAPFTQPICGGISACQALAQRRERPDG